MYPKIIVFEGLDCSFKETNSIALTNYIGKEAKRYTFPDYDNDRSYYIKQFLGKNYPEDIDKKIIRNMYLMEMYDKWNTEIKEDIKNGIKYIIFDRFWYSGLYYNCNTKAEYDDLITNALYTYKLPVSDLLFKMITDPDLMIQKLKEKSSGDIYESNIQKMLEIYNRFNTFNFCGDRQEDIYITEDIGGYTEFKNREEIFANIIECFEAKSEEWS